LCSRRFSFGFAFWFCGNRPWHLALGGLCLGGLYLFRQETAILLPGLILLRFMAPTRGVLWRELLLVAVFGFVAVFPWLYRSWDLTGDPLYNAASLLFHDTDAFPNWTSSRTQAILEMSSWEFVSNNWGDVLQKTAKNGFRFTRDLLLLPGIFLLPFFWLAIWPKRSETRFPLTAPFLLMALTLLVVLSPLEYAPRFLAPIAPLAILVAASGLMRVAENKTQWLQVSPRVLGLLPVLVVGLALATYAGSLWQRSAEPQGTAMVALKDLDRGVAEDGMWPLLLGGVLLTDAPTLYAWVWDRPAIWAPVPEDVQATAERYGRTGVILTCAAGHGDGLQADDLRQAYLSLVDQPPLDQCPTVLRVNR
ncbi:MAG: hypothetical protein HKN21_07030, partial [Candidatus Eisenbacteria bacterium]|nr:hypothetical protein [Candidatus Eisenbacteria bacterium]